MKRKTILLAGKTLVLSLPNEWVKNWGVEKGQELTVEQEGNSLRIKTESQKSCKKTTADITNETERVTRWKLSALHKKGYDEIELIYDKPEQVKLIKELTKDLFTGFSIIRQGDKTITIRALSHDLKETFDQVLRRSFLVTLDLAESTTEYLEKSKNPTELLAMEKTNNQLTNFCQRILNKYGSNDPHNTTFMYVILWNLEKIADDYKYIIKMGQKPSKQTLELMNKTNKMLREYYELFYKLDKKKLNKQAEQREQLEKEIIQLMKTKPEEAEILSHMMHAVQKIADFNASTIAVNDKSSD